MSELTQCNCCTLKQIRSRAKANGQKVTILSDKSFALGGESVYVHPPDVKIRDLSEGPDGERQQYRVAWMMEIGTECGC